MKDIFKCIFLNENFRILNKIYFFILIENMAALIEIMSWRRAGDKPLSQPMLICCFDASMRHSTSMSYTLIRALLWCLFCLLFCNYIYVFECTLMEGICKMMYWLAKTCPLYYEVSYNVSDFVTGFIVTLVISHTEWSLRHPVTLNMLWLAACII